MKTFFTADWHIGEDRFHIMNRPFSSIDEHIEVLIQNHNKLVDPEDYVYVNGDAMYKNADPSLLKQISNFNGRKILIRGNHDVPFSDEVLKDYFDLIVKHGDGIELEFEGKKFFVTHYPTRARKDIWNLTGHIHAAWRFQKNMINVGVDVNHFRPTEVSEVLFLINAIENFYDDDVFAAYNEVNYSYTNRGKKGSYFDSVKE